MKSCCYNGGNKGSNPFFFAKKVDNEKSETYSDACAKNYKTSIQHEIYTIDE